MKPLLVSFLMLALVSMSCQNNSDKQEHKSLNDSTSTTGLTGDSVKLVKTAAINFKVKDVEKCLKSLSDIAHTYGAMVSEQTFRAEEVNRRELKVSSDSLLVISSIAPQADVTVRIPSENLERFFFDAASLGYYTRDSRLKVDDRSLAYLENALKQKARKEVLSSPLHFKKDSIERLQSLQLKEEAFGQFIANKTVDADAAYSTVSLSLSQNTLVNRETVANYAISDYKLTFGQRLDNALKTGWGVFLNFLLAILHLWIFILIGIAGVVGYRHWPYKRRLV